MPFLSFVFKYKALLSIYFDILINSFLFSYSFSNSYYSFILLFYSFLFFTVTDAGAAATAALDAADSKIEVFLDIGSDLDSLEERAFDLIQVINGVLNHIKEQNQN